MEAQEVFDKVARHLLSQGQRSARGSVCRYRGPNGTMCAVGCLIPDEVARVGDDKFYSVAGLGRAQLLPEELRPHEILLSKLQRVHDNALVESWRAELTLLAKAYKLSTAVVAA